MFDGSFGIRQPGAGEVRLQYLEAREIDDKYGKLRIFAVEGLSTN